MQPAKPMIIGLRTNAEPSSDSSDFFSDDSDEENAPLQLLQSPSTYGAVQLLQAHKRRVDSFLDISHHITAFLDNLKEFTITPFTLCEVGFIPEGVVPDELLQLVREFAADLSNDEVYRKIIEWDRSEFPDAILAQLDLVQFVKEKDVDFEVYVEKKLDSRILALVHFAMMKIAEDDLPTALYHNMACLEEFVKFPTVAPIAVLFEDFTMNLLVDGLCRKLVRQFPKHPLVPSVIHNFNEYVDVSDVLEMLPKEEDSGDLGDDFDSDSFFGDLEDMKVQREQPLLQFQGLFKREVIVNPLEMVPPTSKIDAITLTEPPEMVTYLLEDGSADMTPMEFQDWIVSIRFERSEAVKVPISEPIPDRAPACTQSYRSNPILSAVDEPTDESIAEESEEFFLKLITNIDKFSIVKAQIPPIISAQWYGMYLPVLHTVNLLRDTVELRGTTHSKFLTMECEAHSAVSCRDTDRMDRVLVYFANQIVIEDFPVTPIAKKQERRKQPQVDLEVNMSTIASVMSLIDYELVLNGRSPLSLGAFGTETMPREEDVKLGSRQWRVQYMWHIYSNQQFPPYLSFRLAFALAVNLADGNPVMACNFLFEGLYTLLANIPNARKLPCVRSALLFFGELLDKLDKYYYCAMVLDNFFLADIRNTLFSSQIAQIAQRNKDIIRALFHYNQSLRNFIAQNSTESAIYLGQLVASIYIDRAMYVQAVSILTYLLYESYKIPFTKMREKLDVVALGSLRVPIRSRGRDVSFTSVFMPDPKNVSTALCGTSLITVFVKIQLYQQAHKLLGEIWNSCSALSMKKMLSYIKLWVYHRQNDFPNITANLPKLEISRSRASVLSRFGPMVSNSFDPSTASLRLMARIYVNRGQWQQGLFWSEMFVHMSRKISTKELGNGLVLRALSLGYAGLHCTKPMSLAVAEIPSNFGKWTTTQEFTREEIWAEALSSIGAAIICYLRVGSLKKLAFARLIAADFMLDHPGIEARCPKLFSEVFAVAREGLLKFEELRLDLATTVQEAETLATRMMHPLYIVHSELVSARYDLERGKVTEAKQRFGYAVDNFTNMFVCGRHFVPTYLRLKTIRYIFEIIQRMCRLLMMFEDTEFINDHIYLFDVMNDIHFQLNEALKTKVKDSPMATNPSTALSPVVLDLENPKIPKFGPLLVSNGFIDDNLDRNPPEFNDYLSSITANIRLFEQQKMTEDEMTNLNRKTCRLIEQKAENLRRQRSADLPPDTTFTFLKRCCPIAEGVVFVQKLFNEIFIYVPSTGAKRRVPIEPDTSHRPFTVTLQKAEVTVTNKASLFDPKFIEYILGLVSLDKKPPFKVSLPLITERMFSKAATALFGELLDFLMQHKLQTIADDQAFGQSRFFGKSSKGSLATMDPGDHPITIVSSIDLHFLPFEFMLKDCYVLRCPYYTSLMRKATLIGYSEIPKPVICWNRQDLQTVGYTRSMDCIASIVSAVCNNDEPVFTVLDAHATVNMPHPLFKSSKETIFTKRYDFCVFTEVVPEELPRVKNAGSSIFIFSYTDLCDMNNLVNSIVGEYPTAFLMFIPASVTKMALHEIRRIFDRHARRLAFIRSSKESVPIQTRMFDDPSGFVVTLKVTLEKLLKTPIPLVAHVY